MNTCDVVSIGVMFDTHKNITEIAALHNDIKDKYKYYEIFIVANPQVLSLQEKALIFNIPNTRMVVLNAVAPQRAMKKIFFELAIGDYVVVFDSDESEF